MDCDVSLADNKVQPLLPSMARVECCQLQCYDKYVSRTMRCLPDKFIELCHMHLAFLLDLSGDKLELLLCGHEEHKKKKSGLPSVGMFKKKDKSHGLFGHPLTDEGVCLVMPLIKFLKMEKNVTREGLFRKPGNKCRMTSLKELLIAQGPAVSIDPEIFSPNDVACVLKEFVRELPEPLLTERHLEAHRQILALGQHAKTPEDIARYSSRKLSALQLLMLLLPSPAQKLTMNLMQLLQRIADSPESKMTSATLGTIFAPIFFIERKVQPRDLYSQITMTAPAVSFMIDKAHELFQPPKELVMDLTKFWNSIGPASLHPENRESGQLQKSLSGHMLSTNVCYADRELSKCDDVASNTQAELASLLAHVQTLPNTPHCAKLKKQIMKSVDTPEFCGGLRRRSRSIGASIKKRLPVLGRLMSKHGDMPGSNSSSSSDSKTSTSARTRLFECSSHTLETRRSMRAPKPGHKRHYISENCPTTVSSSSNNTPVKQKCQETATSRISLTGTVYHKHSIEAGCETLHTPNRHPANVVSDFVENRTPRSLSSDIENLATCAIENNENLDDLITCDIENEDPTTYNIENKTSNIQISQQHLNSVRTRTSTLTIKSAASSASLDKPGCFQSETRIDYLPHVAVKQITLSVTASRNSSPVINTRQKLSVTASRNSSPVINTRQKPSVTASRNSSPVINTRQKPSFTASRNSSPGINTRQRPIRKPGTPVMTRGALRVIQSNILESSF